MCHQLSFSNSKEEDAEDSSAVSSTVPPQKHISLAQKITAKPIYTICDDFNEEEDFQTVDLNDEHWITDPLPDRHLCIYKHSLPHSLCPFPCPYMDYMPASYVDTLDLFDISEFEDLMATSSDEDIPVLEGQIGY